MVEKRVFPRASAVRVLTQVLGKGEPLDEVLKTVSAGEGSPEAVQWLYEVCSGVLRWKGRLDLAIDSVSLVKKPSGWLRKVLLVAAYQIIVQDRAPAPLVVSETVDLIKKKEGIAPGRFANACLRKIAASSVQWKDLEFQFENDLVAGAQWASMPVWLWKSIVKSYGLEWAKAYALASLERPTLWIRRKNSMDQIEGEPGPVKDSFKPKSLSGEVTRISGFAEGNWIVQDISSQILVNQVSEYLKPNSKVLDLCAAPGGKAVGMAWNGFKVSASDKGNERLRLLQDTVSRAADSIQVVEKPNLDSDYDLVWVDAPCSGSGILRRHPDVRWLKKEADLQKLNIIQRDLFQEGWSRVRPGGQLMYSVCSVLQDEGPKVIQDLKVEGYEAKRWFLLPHEGPFGDGFFACLLTKAP